MFCFDCNFIECNSSENYKMKDIVNKCLLAGDKFLNEMNLKQQRFNCMFLSCHVRVSE